MRWKMEIQPFDYDSEHIEGAKNIPPDVFSRILPDNNEEVTLPDQTVEYLNILDEIKIPSDKYKIISKYHNTIFGHHGVDRTVQYVQKNEESWLNMRAHVSLFIKKCPCCQKMSAIKVPIHTHPFTTSASLPMERLNIDTIGPLPLDRYGNCYITVIIDCFTRFIELYPAHAMSMHNQQLEL